MKSKVSLVFKILAVVFTLVAIASFFMNYISFPHQYKGFWLAAMTVIFPGIGEGGTALFLAAFFVGLTFVFSLLGLKLRGLGTIICAVFCEVSMVVFACKFSHRTIPSWWNEAGSTFDLGVGVYVFMIAIGFALACSIIGLVTHKLNYFEEELYKKSPAPYALNPLNLD